MAMSATANSPPSAPCKAPVVLVQLGDDGYGVVHRIGFRVQGRQVHQVQQDAIAAGRDGFVGLQLTDRSTHVDVEGEDTTALAVLVCRQGRPRDFNTSSLRQAAARWALDIAGGSRSEDWYPGGAAVQQLIDQGRAALID